MAKYKIYGTNKPYGGKVVNINGDMFTTTGGTLEGDSKHVVSTQAPIPSNQTNVNQSVPSSLSQSGTARTAGRRI